MSKNIAIIGGGGFAKEVIEVADMLNYNIYGIYAKESILKNYNHRGYLDKLVEDKENFDGAIVAIGAVNKKGMLIREDIINFLKDNDIKLISLISPLATVSSSVSIGDGVYIAHNVVVSCDVKISENVLINHQAVIGHDSFIENNVSIAPQVFLGGNTVIESNVMLGAAASLIQGIRVGRNSVIGIRSIVLKNIKENSLVVSPPSKIYR
jgi:sugar O-acyltransferase (sialic acid O-acetyltransferase NeuD family)